MSATHAAWLYCSGSSGLSLRPWPRMSQVMTGRSAASAATFGPHIAEEAP